MAKGSLQDAALGGNERGGVMQREVGDGSSPEAGYVTRLSCGNARGGAVRAFDDRWASPTGQAASHAEIGMAERDTFRRDIDHDVEHVVAGNAVDGTVDDVFDDNYVGDRVVSDGDDDNDDAVDNVINDGPAIPEEKPTPRSGNQPRSKSADPQDAESTTSVSRQDLMHQDRNRQDLSREHGRDTGQPPPMGDSECKYNVLQKTPPRFPRGGDKTSSEIPLARAESLPSPSPAATPSGLVEEPISTMEISRSSLVGEEKRFSAGTMGKVQSHLGENNRVSPPRCGRAASFSSQSSSSSSSASSSCIALSPNRSGNGDVLGEDHSASGSAAGAIGKGVLAPVSATDVTGEDSTTRTSTTVRASAAARVSAATRVSATDAISECESTQVSTSGVIGEDASDRVSHSTRVLSAPRVSTAARVPTTSMPPSTLTAIAAVTAAGPTFSSSSSGSTYEGDADSVDTESAIPGVRDEGQATSKRTTSSSWSSDDVAVGSTAGEILIGSISSSSDECSAVKSGANARQQLQSQQGGEGGERSENRLSEKASSDNDKMKVKVKKRLVA